MISKGLTVLGALGLRTARYQVTYNTSIMYLASVLELSHTHHGTNLQSVEQHPNSYVLILNTFAY